MSFKFSYQQYFFYYYYVEFLSLNFKVHERKFFLQNTLEQYKECHSKYKLV
jgi:hypothetical protein